MSNMRVQTTSSTPRRDAPPAAKAAQSPAQSPAFVPRKPVKPAGSQSSSAGGNPRAGVSGPGARSDPRDDLELYGALGTAIAMQHLREAAGLFGEQEQSGDQSEDGSNSNAESDNSRPAAAAWSAIEAMRGDMSMDTDSLSGQLAPLAADDGIFELLMPGNETLGVVVHHGAADLRLLLSPSTEALGRRLKRVQMELEGRLAQRIGRDVNLTVL